MDVYTPPQHVDFTDTGLWRLIVYVSGHGMSAFLRHTDDPAQPVVRLFSTHWKEDETPLLRKIESAVYDNPRLLDDYATDIIIETPRLVWAPSAFLQNDGDEEEVFATFFPSENIEVMTDSVGELTAIYSLADGLSDFIGRTLPGARVRPHIAVIASNLLKNGHPGDTPTLFACIRDEEIDLIATADGRLLGSCTRRHNGSADIAYHVFHLAQAAGLNPGNLKVSLSGSPGMVEAVTTALAESDAEIVNANLHGGYADEMPLAVALLAR